MNVKEREVAIALREIDIAVRELERQGIEVNQDAIEKETAAIRANAEARGASNLEAQRISEAADEMERLHDNIYAATNSFGELFGTAGEGFENLIGTILEYEETQIAAEERIAEARARYGEGSIEHKKEEQRAAAQMAAAEINHYGDMIGAAKSFFSEKSKGFQLLQGVERIYRIFQFAMAAKELLLNTTSIASDTAKTASSVANSGTRAAADGIAAFAKTMASLPFPFNLAAGAAVVAVLVGMGVKMGGGGSKSVSSSALGESSNDDDYEGDSTALTSPYSTLSGDNGLYDPNNAGLSDSRLASDNAYNSASTIVVNDNRVIDARGADAGVEERLQAALDANREATVEEARNAVAEDQAEANGRQSIGNG